jgi:fucose permease
MANRIGAQLRKVFEKNGTAITPIVGSSLSESSTEYILTELSNQATKVFIQEFYLKAYFPYNTVVSPGDYINSNNV